jgi:hypothetical protein
MRTRERARERRKGRRTREDGKKPRKQGLKKRRLRRRTPTEDRYSGGKK